MESVFRNIPIWNIFVLFLIIAANYLGELFPCRVQNLLESNIYLKHIIAFLTLSFFVILTDTTSNYKSNEIFSISFTLYILFIILARNNKVFFLINLVILAILYVMKLQLTDYEKNVDEKSNDIFYERLLILEKVLTLIFFVLLICGFLIYMGEKKIEYKNKFNFITFFFGKPSCKLNSPTINYVEAFLAAFK